MTARNAGQDTGRGIRLMIAAVTVFAVQDGFSRHLAGTYNVFMIIMIRYWFFAAFVVILALRRPGGLRAMRTRHRGLHLARASLLIAEICVIVWGYTLIGLINSHAVFAVCPLLVAALSVPILGERVSWRQWLAIGAGLAGVIVILQPGSGVFTPASLLPFAAATMFALYSLLTRLTTRDEPAFLSLFWTGVIGMVLITPLGLAAWEPIAPADWPGTILYALLALAGNWLLIRCYDVAEASAVQPFAYLQIVLVSLVGVVVFGEALRPAVIAGAGIVVAAGLFSLWYARPRAPVEAPLA